MLMPNADISAPKYTYTVGYWQIFTIISDHINEQQHSIVNTPLFSWRHLTRRKVAHKSRFVVSFDIHQIRYIVFDMIQHVTVSRC